MGFSVLARGGREGGLKVGAERGGVVIGCLADNFLKPTGCFSGSKAHCGRQFSVLNEQRLLDIDPRAIRHPLTLQCHITLGQRTQ